MRRAAIAVMLVLTGCGGGVDYDAFREAYARYLTGGSSFRDQPPAFTDAQIDEVLRRVCVGGAPSLDKADEIGEEIVGGIMGSSAQGTAIMDGVRAIGCPR